MNEIRVAQKKRIHSRVCGVGGEEGRECVVMEKGLWRSQEHENLAVIMEKGLRRSQEHENLALAQHVEVLQRAADSKVLNSRKAEHRHRRHDPERQRDDSLHINNHSIIIIIIISWKTPGIQHSFTNAFPWPCKEEMQFLSTTPW